MRPEFRVIGYLLALCLVSMPVLAAKPTGEEAKKGGPKAAGTTFRLVALDDFESGTNGWPAPGSQTTCSGGDHQLGVAGIYGSGGVKPISKSYTMSGEHSKVRIQATVAFLDKWIGESASLSVDGTVVWSDTWHHCPQVFSDLCRGINVCGDAATADRLGRSIDIIVPHSGDSLTITLQTSLESESSGASFLVDDIRISTF